MSVSRELEDYYSEYLLLFSTPGWQQFMSDMLESKLSLDSLENLTSEKEFFVRKGEVAALDRIIRFQDYIEMAWEELQSDEEPDEAA